MVLMDFLGKRRTVLDTLDKIDRQRRLDQWEAAVKQEPWSWPNEFPSNEELVNAFRQSEFTIIKDALLALVDNESSIMQILRETPHRDYLIKTLPNITTSKYLAELSLLYHHDLIALQLIRLRAQEVRSTQTSR